jgi:hypothetical protein
MPMKRYVPPKLPTDDPERRWKCSNAEDLVSIWCPVTGRGPRLPGSNKIENSSTATAVRGASFFAASG